MLILVSVVKDLTALLEYLNVLLEYIDLLVVFQLISRHSCHNVSDIKILINLTLSQEEAHSLILLIIPVDI